MSRETDIQQCSVNQTRQIDQLCEEFEHEWMSGCTPSLQEYLERWNDRPTRGIVFERLLDLDLTCRRRLDDTIADDWYVRTFPEYADLIDDVLRSQTRTQSDSLQFSHDTTLSLGSAPIRRGISPAPRPGDKFGRYEILEEIARGGMGVVYKARQPDLNRFVALKTIKSAELADEDEVQRFHSEAISAANLDHPNIVPVFEVGDCEGCHFFSMGYIEGDSLATKLRDGPLSPDHAATLTKTLAQAIDYAHRQGIVHRDLKPANVLVDQSGNPKITDFGLAKSIASDSGLTATGQVMGTPSFMPPEQAQGKINEVGAAADIYSLGAMLYCLLTGRPPFQASTVLETLNQVIQDPPVAPRQLNGAVAKDLETICLKCLSKRPETRYTSAAALADDLQRYLDGLPILARPVGSFEKTLRWCQRNPVVTALSVLFFVSLLAGIAGSTYFGLLMRAEAIRAKQNADVASRHQRASERNARAASGARQQAERRQYDALLSKTQLFLSTAEGELGWTWQALQDIREAAQLDVPDRDEATLRSVCLRALMTLDVRKLGTIPLVKPNTFAHDLIFGPEGRKLFIAESKGVPSCYLQAVDVETFEVAEQYEISTLNANYLSRLIRSPKRYQTGFRSVAVSADGRWLAAGGRFGEIWIWDRTLPAAQPVELSMNETVVFHLQFTPDCKTLYASTNKSDNAEAEIRVWKHTERWEFSHAIEGYGYDFCLSHDGKRLAVKADQLAIFDVETRRVLTRGRASTHPAFSRDDSFLGTVDPSALTVLTTDTLEKVVRVTDSQFEQSGFFQGDQPKFLGDTLFFAVSGTSTEGVRIYDPETSRRLATIPTPGRTESAIAVSPTGRLIAVTEANGVGLYEVRLPIDRQSRPSIQMIVEDIEFSPNGQVVAILSRSSGNRLLASELHMVETADWSDSARWRIQHSDHPGAAISNTKDLRMAVSPAPSSASWCLAEPQMGVQIRDSKGSFKFPQAMPRLRLNSLKIPRNAEVPQSILLPVGEPIPYGNGAERDALEISLTEVLNKQSPRMISDKDRYLVFVNLSVGSSDLPHVAVHAKLTVKDSEVISITQSVRANESMQAFSCGYLSREHIERPLAVRVFLEDLGDENIDPSEIMLESILLIAKPDFRSDPSFAPGGPLCISKSKDRLVAAVNSETLASWRWPEGDLLYSYHDQMQAALRGDSGIDAVAAADGVTLVGSRGGAVIVLDSSSGKHLAAIPGPGGGIRDLKYFDESQFLLATEQGHVALVDWQSETIRTLCKVESAVLRCAAGHIGALICFATKDGQIGLMRFLDGKWRDYITLGPFQAPVADVALSPDGRFLVYALSGEARNAHRIDLDAFHLTMGIMSAEANGVDEFPELSDFEDAMASTLQQRRPKGGNLHAEP